MALLFMDGFDHYATSTSGSKWSSFNATINSSGGRRNGGYALVGFYYGDGLKKSITNTTDLVIGFAFRKSEPYNGNFLYLFSSNDQSQCYLRMNGDNSISICRPGDVVLGSSAADKLKTSIWNHIEWKVTIADSILANTCILKINGEEVINLPAGTDTKGYASQTGVSTLYFTKPGGYGTYDYDDLYICDQSGTTCNNFLGDCRIDTIYPNIDGTYANGIPSSGTTHYTLIDESVPNTTDYITLGTVGNKDSYGYSDLTQTTNTLIYGVQVNAYWQKNDAGARNAAMFVRSGTTDLDGTSIALANVYTYGTQIFTTDPNTNIAWTRGAINNAEFGIKVTT